MTARRALWALLSFLVLVSLMAGGIDQARAQVEDEERQANEAEQARKAAYSLVDATTADRDRVETELAEAMLRYNESAETLATADRALLEVEDALESAELQAQGLEIRLDEQTLAAYMQSVGNTTEIVLDADLSSALVASHLLELVRGDTEEILGDLTAQKQHLDGLRVKAQLERERVAELTAEMEAEASRLEELFAAANTELAAAIRKARQADANYRAAMTAVERARAEEAAKKKPPPTTNPREPAKKVIPKARVLAWRPMIETHFASDLVDAALIIMQCESGGDPNAINRSSGASGLFQFMPGTWATSSVKAGVGDRSVFDGEANIIAASWLAEYYRSRGYDPWRPWTCRKWL